MNYACLVSVAFTLYPSSYTALMLTTSLPAVSSGDLKMSTVCQSTKPKGEVLERTEKRIWGRWGRRSNPALKPGRMKHRDRRGPTGLLHSKGFSTCEVRVLLGPVPNDS